MAITVKHKFVSAIPDGTDATIVRPSNWNDDHDLTGTIPVANGGTGASTASGGLNNLLPSQTGNNGKVLATDGTNASWTTNGSGDVVGPSSATDNAIARFDGTTGKLIKNSGVTVDDNSNITTNNLFEGFSNTAASGTQIVLTAASVPSYVITGSGGQTIKLPDATTLPNGTTFAFNNNQSSGAISVNNNSNTLIVSIPSGAFTIVTLLSNSIAAGSWDTHDQAPANVSWSTNTFNYAGSFTNGTWNGNTVQVNRGGTGQSSALVAGAVVYGSSTTAMGVTAAGTSGQVLTSAGAGTPTWTTPATGSVTSVGGTGTVSGISLSGTVTSTGNLTLGGTLDLSAPPAIGGTTPAAGTFTTITGQTEVLKGTGTNMVPYSQALATGSSWVVLNATATNNATTAPDSTSTATSLIESATTASHWEFTTQTPILPIGTYTMSVYAKANGRTVVIAGIAYNGSGTTNYGTVTFDLSGVAVTQTNANGYTVVSSSITSVGSGWYRCVATISLTSVQTGVLTVVGVSNATTYTVSNYGMNSYAGNGTSGLYLWGAQLEPYSTVGTYVPTTTTPLLGSPTLSLSNLSVIGLQNDGALYLQPYNTGALQAQATTSTTVGGNARGTNAVDWQTIRSAASQVANGTGATIGGGYANLASGSYSVISGGYANTVNAPYSSAVGGDTNTASGIRAVAVGGVLNTASGVISFIGGGYSNTATGYYSTIGGGYANSGTANAAVTTQSGTMNGTTAVTLSGSNANIKVGQLITGTSINTFPNTYVAAISGTSLTLSQNASGSSTSTLSFYTPHGVVVGGGNNQATGSYSFIGGGGDAGTAANRNVASGDWSTVAGGQTNTASGIYGIVAGGQGNTASAGGSFVGGGGYYYGTGTGNTASGGTASVLGGSLNTASGNGASVIGGYNNTANGKNSSILGGRSGTTRNIVGNIASPACDVPFSSTLGSCQAALLVLGVQTTDATATVLRSDSTAASGTNQVILPNNSAYYFTGEVISGVTAGGDSKGWEIAGVIKRGANAASTTLVGSTVTSLYADAGAATWTIGLTADTTNGGLKVTFTGQASTTIRTVCQIRTTEMTY